jgi:hypothetical protein
MHESDPSANPAPTGINPAALELRDAAKLLGISEALLRDGVRFRTTRTRRGCFSVARAFCPCRTFFNHGRDARATVNPDADQTYSPQRAQRSPAFRLRGGT